MLNALAAASAPAPDLDRGLARVAAILMPLIGGMSFVIQPGFVQGMVEYAGFTDTQAGYIAAAEMTGFAITGVALTVLAPRLHWRKALVILLLLSTLMNVASGLVHGFEAFAACRFLAGLGSGGVMSLGFATIGLTTHTERNFGWNIGLAGLVGAVVMFALPTLLKLFGVAALLGWFIAWNLLGLWLLRQLPASGDDRPVAAADAVDLPWTVKGPALAAMLLYFAAQGAVWAYLFLMGTAGALGEQAVANALTLAGLAGIAGGFTPVLLGNRYGRALPLAIGLLAGLVPMVYLALPFPASGYTVAVCVYNFAWNMTHPYLLATYASFDRTGRLVVYAAALQTIGMALGPALGASVITAGRYVNINWLAVALFACCLALVVPAAIVQARHVGRRTPRPEPVASA